MASISRIAQSSAACGCALYGLRAHGAKVAELVDALDLGSSGVTRESSSLSFRTSASLRRGPIAQGCTRFTGACRELKDRGLSCKYL